MQQFQMLAAVSVELVPSRVMLEIYSVPLVHLELLFLMVAPRPQTQILVFVERMLNSILKQIDASALQDMAGMQQLQVLVAAHVEQGHLRAIWAMSSAPPAHLDHLFLVVAPRLQVQILVFVEEMLR